MKDIKIAVIGCGKQAPKHISGLRSIPGVEVVLADIDASLAKSLAQKEGLTAYESVDEAFADASVHAVSLCTPTFTHQSLIEKAIANGKDFLCEKPLCENLNEAVALEKTMMDTDRIGMVGYIYRFAPVFEEAKRLLGDGRESLVLGELTAAHFRLGGRGSHQQWKHMQASAGGAVNEMLVHMVDLALWFFGKPSKVEVLADELLRPEREIQGKKVQVDANDYALVRLDFEGGMQVICQADLVTPAFTQFVEIQGDQGSFMGSIQPDMPSFVFAQRSTAGFDAGKNVMQFGARNLFEAQMAEFVQAVRTRKKPDRNTVEDSMQLIKVMDQIKKEMDQ